MRALSSLGRRVLCWLSADESLRQRLDYHVPRAIQHVENGEHHRAVPHYHRAVAATQCLGLRTLQGQLMGNLGGAYLALAAYDKARLYSQQAVELARETRDEGGEATALANLGNVYLYQGQINEAVKYFEDARAAARKSGSPSEITALIGLGAANNLRGRFDRAIQYLNEAIALAEAQNDQAGLGSCWVNLANVHNNLGDHQMAVECGQRALSYIEGSKREQAWGRALTTLGNALADWGDACDDRSEQEAKWEEAVQRLDQAREVAEALSDSEVQLMALLNRAAVLIRQEDLPGAITELETGAIPMAQAIGDKRAEAYCYVNRADAQVRTGQHKEREAPGTGRAHFDQAETDYQRALPKLEATADDRGQRAVYSKLGSLYARWLEDMEKAYHNYETAINLWEQTRGWLVEETHRIGFLGRGLDAYTGLTLLCVRRHQPAEALFTAESAKSRTFLERLAYSHVRAPEQVSPQLLAREAKLVPELQRVGYAVRQASGKQRKGLRDELDNLLGAWEGLLNEMEPLAPDYVALREGAPSTFIEIRGCLELE